MDKQTFYFTFGTGSHYQPYAGGWVEVRASSEEEAVKAFNAKYPPENGIVRCAFIYPKNRFQLTSMYRDGNFGVKCHEVIEGD